MEMVSLETSIRKVADGTVIVDISGDLTRHAEATLNQAFADTSAPGIHTVILGFDEMTYMNSSGIGLLIMLLVRAQRQDQRLFGCGLAEHFRQIFELTRLNEAILLFDSEADALAAAQAA